MPQHITEAAPEGADDRTLPADPILTIIRGRGGLAEVLRHLDYDDTEAQRLRMVYHRGQNDGRLSVAKADELAIRVLGLHPVLIYGDDWLDHGNGIEHDPSRGKLASNSAYSRGCRCFDCSEAHRAYAAMSRERARRRAAAAAATADDDTVVIDLREHADDAALADA
jgi:hypothetical protein